MSAKVASQFGFFTIFGFTKRPQHLLEHKLPELFGIVPRIIDFGTTGHFFFYSSYGDVAETEEAIALKLGFVRSPTMSSLSVKALLTQNVLGPKSVDHNAFRGNALIASFSKREPRFLAFKTILSAPQLYYSVVKDGILCATGLRPLITMLDQIEINEEAIVPQFLFGAMPGPATHFRNVYRLFPGELLKWKEENLTVDLLQDLRFVSDGPSFERADPQAIDALYEQFRDIVSLYIDDIEKSEAGFANLLSGGVDSSLLQLAINEQRPGFQTRSFSYAVRVPSFAHEIEYAEQAVSVFNTDHTFIDIVEEEYPNLLIKTTEILAQPALTPAESCKLAIAEAVSKMASGPQFLFVAQGADTLFGLKISQKIKMLESLKRIPASGLALTLTGTLLKPLTKRGQTLLNLADILNHWDNPHHFNAPINTEATIANFALARRCFGDEAIRQALEDRRNREAVYLDSKDYTEKVHIMELLADCYEIEVQSSQLFLAYNTEQIYPFLDEDTIRLSFAFQPQIRYVQGLRHKFLLKKLLEQRVASPITRQRKGGSMFHPDLYRWMKSGLLHKMVRDISLPGSLSRTDFERLVKRPDHSLWHLLAFDVFQKQILKINAKNQ